MIGERTAEELKITIGSALPLEDDESSGVRGRDQITGLPRTIQVRSSEVSQVIQEHLGSIVQTVRAVLERTPPELASDVIDHGIVLTGGGARLRHIDDLLMHEIGVPVHVAEEPEPVHRQGSGRRARLPRGDRTQHPDGGGVAHRRVALRAHVPLAYDAEAACRSERLRW